MKQWSKATGQRSPFYWTNSNGGICSMFIAHQHNERSSIKVLCPLSFTY